MAGTPQLTASHYPRKTKIMAQKHKIGVHVSAQQRDNYGVAAPHLVSVVSFDPGAFDELPKKAIKIFRTHAVHDHKDAPGDFDRLKDSELEGAAEFWWSILKREYEPIRRRYGDDVYFQPINEINNPRTVPYLRGMVKAAEKDGYKLALWGDAGGSPDLPDWIATWMPFMKEVQAGGHIYSRHAYSGVSMEFGSPDNRTVFLTKPDGTPTDSNTGRPFVEAKLMLENGIHMPMVITELGWLGGWNNLPDGWLDDILRYNKLMMEHDNIVGSCLWNAGQWETAPNILAGRPLLDLGNQLKTMEPQFYVPGSIKLPEGPITDTPDVGTPQPGTPPAPTRPIFVPSQPDPKPEVPAPAAPTPAPVPVPTPDVRPTVKHKAIIIKVGQEESAAGAARLMERYAFDRRRSLTFSTDDMLTLLRGGNDQSIVEIYRPELPSNQHAIELLLAAGYSWREIKLDWGR